MKNRILSIALILVLSASLAIAQEKSKMSVGILGGVNYQNLNGKDSGGNKLSNDMLLGFHGGLNVQIPIAPEFYFQPGIMYTMKGAKNTSAMLTSTTKLNYIEVPLDLVYKAALGKGFFMLGFGPYVSYGISGNVKTTGGSLTLDRKVVFKNTVEILDNPMTPYFKALDAGANIFVGYEMASGLFLQLDTEYGLLNINPKYKLLSDDKSSTKNTGFGLSLGYRF